jgi:dihydrofolate reductase|tara:strand:- start:657 stop:1229 length:573 start_codon:yes stop_codon:yes gene_type:complete
MNIIVSVDEHNCIGNNNDLIYDIKEDKIYFREVTSGSAVVMGRNTWESIPRKPLPNRINIIISKTLLDADYPDTFIYDSFETFMLNVYQNTFINPITSQCYAIYIIGGSQLYSHVLQHYEVDTIYKTVIKDPQVSPTVLSHPIYFPAVDWNKYTLIHTTSHMTTNYTCQYHKTNEPVECIFEIYFQGETI